MVAGRREIAMPEVTKDIPAHVALIGCAMFYDPDKVFDSNGTFNPSAITGIHIDEFKRNWLPFTFVMSYALSDDGKTERQVRIMLHRFDEAIIWQQLANEIVGPHSLPK